MAIKIDHIGIAVKAIEEALEPYCAVFGLKPEEIERETVEEQKTTAAIIPVSGSRIELIESTDPEGPVAKFIAKRGEGIHHLALEVSDIRATIKLLRERGIPLVNEEPREGVGGSRVAFLHPKGTKALIELVEH